MLNPPICSRCSHSRREKMPKYDTKTNKKISVWSIDCYLDKKSPITMMIASDDPPDECPYILEHSIIMGNLDREDREFIADIE